MKAKIIIVGSTGKLGVKLLKFCKTYCQKSQNLKVEIEKSIKK